MVEAIENSTTQADEEMTENRFMPREEDMVELSAVDMNDSEEVIMS